MTFEDFSEPARRVRRPSWRDPRLAVGILLVAASVALGSWIVSGSAQGVAVYAAREVLTPGEPVGEADLVVVEVRAPGAAERYLAAAAPLPADAVVTRLVGEGELVPVSAVGSEADVAVQPISVPVAGVLGSSVEPGVLVDLWLVPSGARLPGSADTSEAPELVAGGLLVAAVNTGDSVLSGVGGSTVEVLVPRDRVAQVLAALAADGTVTLVPLLGGP